MPTATFTVRGHKVRTASQRRYVVVAVRPKPITTEHGTYVAFARIDKRSDNIKTAKDYARRYGLKNGAFAVVIDTTTGQEV